jgi:hypothetical protein
VPRIQNQRLFNAAVHVLASLLANLAWFFISGLPVRISMGVVRSFCGFTAILVAVLAVWLSLPPARVQLSSWMPGPLPSPLTEAQQQEYADNGVVLVKQLFRGEQLAELISESEKALKKRDLMDFVATSYHKLVFGLWRTRTPFAKAAFESSMPSIAQQLLHEEKSVRILKVQLMLYRLYIPCGVAVHAEQDLHACALAIRFQNDHNSPSGFLQVSYI